MVIVIAAVASVVGPLLEILPLRSTTAPAWPVLTKLILPVVLLPVTVVLAEVFDAYTNVPLIYISPSTKVLPLMALLIRAFLTKYWLPTLPFVNVIGAVPTICFELYEVKPLFVPDDKLAVPWLNDNLLLPSVTTAVVAALLFPIAVAAVPEVLIFVLPTMVVAPFRFAAPVYGSRCRRC